MLTSYGSGGASNHAGRAAFGSSDTVTEIPLREPSAPPAYRHHTSLSLVSTRSRATPRRHSPGVSGQLPGPRSTTHPPVPRRQAAAPPSVRPTQPSKHERRDPAKQLARRTPP